MEWLRARQGKDTIVFLDEFEKIKQAVSPIGFEQAGPIYTSFLEPWQEGTLSDNSAGNDGTKIDVSRVVWILTSNWGQDIIIDFAQRNAARVYDQMGADDLAWLTKELIKQLVQEVQTQLRGVNKEVMALARRINYTIPFLPFTHDERRVVADSVIRRKFQEWRSPAVLTGSANDRKTFGNMNCVHTGAFAAYAVEQYEPTEGASSIHRPIQQLNDQFVEAITDNKFKLSAATISRIESDKLPRVPGQQGHVPEPNFWAHYDENHETIKILLTEPPEPQKRCVPKSLPGNESTTDVQAVDSGSIKPCPENGSPLDAQPPAVNPFA